MTTWVATASHAEALAERPAGSAASRAATALLVVALLVAALSAGGAALGYRGVAILSGSMEPAISTGDLAVVDTIRASEMRVGDVVTFRAEAGFSVTHRVTAVRTKSDGALAVTTRGDANVAPERWATSPKATVGRVVTTVPELGALTRWTASENGRLIVLGIVAAFGAGLALRRIWGT